MSFQDRFYLGTSKIPLTLNNGEDFYSIVPSVQMLRSHEARKRAKYKWIHRRRETGSECNAGGFNCPVLVSPIHPLIPSIVILVPTKWAWTGVSIIKLQESLATPP